MPSEVGRLAQGPRPSSRAICAQSVPTTPSTSCGRDAGVGECPKRPDQRDRGRVVIRQGARLHRVVDAGDGHVTKGV